MNKVITFLFVIAPFLLFGQDNECFGDEMQAQFLTKYAAFHQVQANVEQQALDFFQQRQHSSDLESKSLPPDLTIPVVVHVIHNNGPENLPDADILLAIQNLNDGFAKTGIYEQGHGVNSNIQFCLAQRDPDGNLTSGINRVVSPLTITTINQGDALKDLIRWAPLDYLNIWIVKSINNGATSGYANFPYFHGTDADGIVVSFQGMVNSGSSTLIHEAGHYLGLYHTFAGGCSNDDCLISGDKVCDTPPDNTTFNVFDCTDVFNSCDSDAQSGFGTDQNDLNWNFLDEGNRLCRDGFTQGQADRMYYMLENERTSLLSSKGCLFPCLDQLTASFTASILTVNVGGVVNFTNTSINATNYQWLLNGVQFSTATNAVRTFNTVGNHEVTLVASNGDAMCTQSFGILIEVVCPVEANFAISDINPMAGQTISFFNLTDPPGFNDWYVNGVLISSGLQTNYLVPAVGNYEISLIVETFLETCKDTLTQHIEAICLDASFSVSNPYPVPGEVVNFDNNTEGGATSNVWTVNGMQIGNSSNLDYIFETQGSYTVCLEAQTPFCTDQICTTVFVFEESGEGCNGTYIKNMGFWSSMDMIPDQDGGYFMAGSNVIFTGSNVLRKFSPDGELLWAKSFSVSPYVDYISRIILDSENNLVMSGYSYFVENNSANTPKGFFTVKYSPQLDSVYWTQYFPELSYSTFIGSLSEKEPGGNYLALGNSIAFTTTSVGSEQFYMEFDRLSGEPIIIQQSGPTLDGFKESIVYDDGVYGIGATSNSLFNGKATLSRFDFTGNRLWSRNYFNSINASANTTFGKILIENDSLLLFGNGSFTSNVNQDKVLFLIKTDTDGEVQWTKQYDMVPVEAFDPHANTIVSLPDGYFLAGTMVFGTQNVLHNAGYFIRLDKQGNMLWAKRSVLPITHAYALDGYIYFTSGSTFGRMTLDGEINGGSCNLLTDLSVAVSDTPNQFSELLTLTQGNYDIPSDTVTAVLQPVSAAINYWNGCFCTEPIDPCYTASDAMLTSVNVACIGDSMLVTLSIYNNSTGDLPEGTPVVFYNGNPTTGPAAVIANHPLPNKVAYNSTKTFSFHIVGSANTPIYVVVNDNGTTPAPWSLDDFPNADAAECFFQNNMTSFQVNFPLPILDIGVDTAICDNSTATFVAAPGFTDYTWQDGSKELNFTAWLPGDYWVVAKDGCGGIQSDTVMVSFNPTTVANLGPDTIVVCMGGQVTFTVNGFDYYNWTPTEGLSCDDCASVTVSPISNIQYNLFASTAAGCYSADSVWLVILPLDTVYSEVIFCEGDTVEVFGNPVTMPGFYSMTFDGLNGCDSTSIIQLNMSPGISLSYQTIEEVFEFSLGSITVTVNGGTGPFHYFWSNGAPDTNYLDGLESGSYAVTVVDSLGCSAIANIYVPLGVSTSEETNIQEFFIGPNPTSGSLNVRLLLKKPATVQMEILDVLGRVVRSTSPLTTTENTWELNLNELAAATYFCKLTIDGKVNIHSFVKQ